MQTVRWEFYPLVAHNSVTRAFIEELAQVRKSPSTLDNYGRDLEDFLQAVSALPFEDVLEADETLIAQYVDGLWSRPARRGSGHQTSRDKITYMRAVRTHQPRGQTWASFLRNHAAQIWACDALSGHGSLLSTARRPSSSSNCNLGK